MSGLFCWHDWEKWSDPVNGVMCDSHAGMGWFQVCQHRSCVKCGVTQVRKLPKMRSLDKLKEER